jgi:hypothetical protein
MVLKKTFFKYTELVQKINEYFASRIALTGRGYAIE